MHSLYFHILPLYSTLFLTLCFPLPLSLTHFSHYFSPFSSSPLTLLPVGGPLSFSHLFPHALYLSLSPFLILSFSPFSLSPLLPLLPITLCLCCLPLFQTLTLPSSSHFFPLTLSHSPFLFCSLSPVGAPLPHLCLSLSLFPSLNSPLFLPSFSCLVPCVLSFFPLSFSPVGGSLSPLSRCLPLWLPLSVQLQSESCPALDRTLTARLSSAQICCPWDICSSLDFYNISVCH